MNEQDGIQRTVLPIPDRPHIGLTTYDAKDPNTKFPAIERLRPPKNAPNVLVVLLDDATRTTKTSPTVTSDSRQTFAPRLPLLISGRPRLDGRHRRTGSRD
jgi:hypothetical protein